MSPEGKTPKPVRRKVAGVSDNSSTDGYLDGQLLIAMPVMGDPRFERSVIYMCAHSSEGAMGIIVNRPAGSIDFPGLLVQLDIIKKTEQIELPENAETMRVLKGGPVETGRGFVLHSSDFFIEDATLRVELRDNSRDWIRTNRDSKKLALSLFQKWSEVREGHKLSMPQVEDSLSALNRT